jgi:hypothetical protein
MGRGKRTIFESILGSFQTVEIKRGKNSGLWHPHTHMVAFCDSMPCQYEASREWQEITGDSYVVDVRKIRAENEQELLDALCEVCAYLTKFSEMDPMDAWHVREVTRRKHLRQAYGTFRFSKEELEEIESQDDPELDGPYVDMFYEWSARRGYVLTREESHTHDRSHLEAAFF